MQRTARAPTHSRNDDRTIIHVVSAAEDYDCFYASVVENENPQLKTLPLAVQQKQIIVTCNYEARRRGLHKLQLITEAKRVCPDVIIVLGEDLTRFRDASKSLYNYLRAFSWNDRVERLGFDEVWMDITDAVDYNVDLLNRHDLKHSFFQLKRDDPTAGFNFDAAEAAGHQFPCLEARQDCRADTNQTFLDQPAAGDLRTRLVLGSHLALYLRRQLNEHRGYTCTVGVSTNKLLSKLVGNLNKPHDQTTLMSPYEGTSPMAVSNIQIFMDSHDIGAVPWIGFKHAQKLREHYLGRAADFHAGLVYGKTKEKITVRDICTIPDLTSDSLEKVLGGPGAPKGIGTRVFGLLHGIDDTEVALAKNVPCQISIEDSYIRLDTLLQLTTELSTLGKRLLQRMRLDLTEPEDHDNLVGGTSNKPSYPPPLRWVGRPSNLRLTTRPRQPLQADGTRVRSFKRISRSRSLPKFAFNLSEHIDALAARLVNEALMPLFRRLHPEKSGWNLSLVNVAVTDMADTGVESKNSAGRNIERMLKDQDDVLKEFQSCSEEQADLTVTSPASNVEVDLPHDATGGTVHDRVDMTHSPDLWRPDSDDEDELFDNSFYCELCHSVVPLFARMAHERYHADHG